MSKLEPARTYSNPTANDILRRLLDERGVEWGASDTYRLLVTSWNDVSGHSWAFMEHRDGSFSKLTAYHITPEQAIAATLGATDAKPTQAESSGTCHDVGDPTDFCCSECGVRMFTDTSDTYTMIASDGHTIIKRPKYCPNCGRKVVTNG